MIVEVDQRPLHPLTAQAGGSLAVGERVELLAELGANLDDALMGIFSAAVRF